AAVGLVNDDALREYRREGLVDLQVFRGLHAARKEARVQQMQNRVLLAADILVDGRPVLDRLLVGRSRGVRRAKAELVPGAVDEGIHGVRFAHGRLTALRARDVLPRRMMVQRIAGPAERSVLRK